MGKKKFFWEFTGHLFWILLIIVLGIGLSFLFRFWQGYPPGSDWPGHLFFIEFIERFYPHNNWVYVWAGGIPAYLWYPSLIHLIVAVFHQITSLSNEFLLTSAGLVCFILTAIGVYGLTWQCTRQRFISFVCALLCLSTPSLWSTVYSAGAYARALSIAFLAITAFFSVRLFFGIYKEKYSKFDYIATVIFLALTFLAHYFIAMIAFLLIALLALFLVKKFWQKILWIIKIFIPTILLTAYFSLPFIIWRAPGSVFIRGKENFNPEYMFASWAELINDGRIFVMKAGWQNMWALSPFLLPLILLVFLLVLIFCHKRLVNFKPMVLIFWVYLVISCLFLIYSKFSLPIVSHYYGSGILDPRHALQILPIFLAPLLGMLWYLLFYRSPFRFVSFLIILGLCVWLPFHYHFDGVKISRNPNIALNETVDIFKKYLPENQFNFRVGLGNYGGIAAWFNSYFPLLPQTRDYFATGVVIPDDYFYLVQAGWYWLDNPQETAFLFDWWAVKQFLVNPNEKVDQKFSSNQDDYQYLDSGGGFKIYQYQNPSPVMEQTLAPSILVVGEKTSYDIVFRSLAASNLNSRYFIPLRGPLYIDDLDPKEVSKFKMLFLYNFKWHDKRQASQILNNYLKGGGAIFVEENKSGNRSSDLGFFSFSNVADVSFGTDWQLIQTQEGSKILKDTDFSKWSAPIFDNGPWRMIQANDVADSSQILLTNFKQPILISEEKEAGRLIWSGMNLPYHIVSYKNKEEGRILGQLLAWLIQEEGPQKNPPLEATLENLTYKTADYKVSFINPQERIITANQSRGGVLFKEAYFKDWHAYINGKSSPIYKAGPNFMYLPLSDQLGSVEIRFVYKKSFFPEKLGSLISLLTLLGLLWYLLEGKLKFKPLAGLGNIFAARFKKAKEKGSAWWDKEE
jgi:hypothetical protein